MRWLAAVLLFAVSVVVMGGTPPIRPSVPSGRPVTAPKPVKPFVSSTGNAPQQPPSEQNVLAQMAQVIPPPPGVPYVEILPDLPPAFAADPYASPSPSHNLIGQHGPPLATLSRTANRGRQNPSLHHMLITVGGPNVTGVNRWWDYEEDSIGGVGRYMANIGTGNLVMQASDMAVPHKGIELAFQRTYNSYSQHDYANSDHSVEDNYGDGWTNTFDAHIVKNSLTPGNGGGIIVFDIDGARYDYEKDCPSTCYYKINSPAGQFAILSYDNTTGWFYWTKKSGTVYLFHNTTDTAGVAGRLAKIWGRDNYNKLTFTYSFDTGQTQTFQYLNTTTVQTETSTGQSMTATLHFSDVVLNPQGPNKSTHRLLTSLVWPDGTTTITYHYDTTGRLTQVDEPTNNATNSPIPQIYQYSGTGYLLSQVAGGRWTLTSNSQGTNSTDGGYVGFDYSGNSVAHVSYYGWINPAIPDGVSSSQAIQPSYPSEYLPPTPYRLVTLTYNTGSAFPSPAPNPSATACPSNVAGTTAWSDTDQHATYYCWDGQNRVVQSEVLTGDPSPGPSNPTPGPAYFVTTESWDAQNDLVSVVDPRNKETDYAYDVNGNTMAVALPDPSPPSYRPTSYYSYDANNNVTAYCDPVEVHTAQLDWNATPSPSTSPCSMVTQKTQTTSYTWQAPSDAPEPFGQLMTIVKPSGYAITFTYDPNSQTGQDFGLPTKVEGTQFTQNDSTSVTPKQKFVYNFRGDLICYNKLSANATDGWWLLVYDALGRVTQIADPDDSSISGCGKLPGLPTSTIATTNTYFADGVLKTSQKPSEAAAGVATQYAYDPDGNETQRTAHYDEATPSAGATPTTQKWYDSDERLVEVQQPYDGRGSPAHDYYTTPWLTRYLYDLSRSGGNGTFGTFSGIKAYGNLLKTEEYVALPNQGTVWNDVSASGYDALDRVVATYVYPPNDNTARQSTKSYDSSGYTGQLTYTCNAMTECATRTYDFDGLLSTISFTGSVTPQRTYSYDANGRVLSVLTTANGTQSYVYDADGNLASSSEPLGSVQTLAPSIISYDYYPNGWRKDLSVTPRVTGMGLNQTNLFTYSYRQDGLLQQQAVNYAAPSPNPTVTGSFGWTYTSAGRPLKKTDPYYPNLNSPAGVTSYGSDGNHGQVYSMGIPAGLYQSFVYDPEGEIKSVAAYGETQNISYSIRAEIAGINFLPNQTLWPNISTQLANGAQTKANVWDRRDGVSYGFGDSNNGGTWFYDAAGRQSSGTDWYLYNLPGGGGQVQFTGGMARSYDVENHLITTSYTSWDFGTVKSAECKPDQSVFGGPPRYTATASYRWGPNGHPIQQGISALPLNVGGTPPPVSYRTLHWDGDSLLFTTNSAGSVEDVKIGFLGDITPNDSVWPGLTVWDRDSRGLIASWHTSNAGYGSWNPPMPDHQTCLSDLAPASHGTVAMPAGFSWYYSLSNDAGGLLMEGATDGFYDGVNVIQGVRNYDPAMKAWTTPDAFAGDVSDPISQKTYAYNRNNPFEYHDPSGYNGEETGNPYLDAGIAVGEEVIESPAGQEVEQQAEKLAAEVATKFEESPTVGQLKAFAKQFAEKGKKSLMDSLKSFEKLIGEHTDKLKDIKQQSGYTSSVEKEIRNFKGSINAIKQLLDEPPNE